MNPHENRIKAAAAMFLTVSLFLVRGAHATVQASQGCTITGTPAADLLFGGPGKDKLQGGHGRDVSFGGDGNDTFFDWDGFADRLDGGAGNDRAWRDKLDRVARIERFG